MALIITGTNKLGLGVVEAYLLVSTAAVTKGFQLDDNFLNPKVATKFRAELAIFKDQPTRLLFNQTPILQEVIQFEHADGLYLVDEAYQWIKSNGIPGWNITSVRDSQ